MLLVLAASFGFAHVGITPEVAGPAGSYLRILNLGTLPLLLYGAARRYLQGVGQVRVITVTFVVANLVNWVGNWVLIYGKLGLPAMGVDGSAISTCLARVGMAVALIGFAWRYERSRGHPLFRHWARPSLLKIRQLVRLGSPAAGQIVLEVGAWNLGDVFGGVSDPCGAGHAYHCAELRERHVHGAAGDVGGGGGERGARRWGQATPAGRGGPAGWRWGWAQASCSRRGWCFWWRRGR